MTEWKPVEHLSDDVRKVELQQRDEVKTAAQEFTSFFLSHLMQQQRKTIDKSDLMDGGQGEQMFTGLLDQEYGKKLAMREDGINRMLINDWARGLGGYVTTAARSGVGTSPALPDGKSGNLIGKMPVQLAKAYGDAK
ncbi:MAG: rod-binding protein [Planctomycetes bacterium]|nr:rod-binding protein [Planctomycetota bacterium]